MFNYNAPQFRINRITVNIVCSIICLFLSFSFSVSVCLSVCQSISLSVCLSLCLILSYNLSVFSLSLSLYLSLSLCLSLCLSVCLSVSLSLSYLTWLEAEDDLDLLEAGELDRERSEPDPLLAGDLSEPEIDRGGLLFWERAVLLDKFQSG
jgi:hypothetical protein